MRRIVSLICLLTAVFAGTCRAFDDGFGSARKMEGSHFTVYVASQVDTGVLAMQLDFNATAAIDGGTSASTLAGMLDRLFSRVCDIMDMQLYSYQGTIKVCRDAGHLDAVYRQLFSRDTDLSAFYVNELNTIYVDAQHFNSWVLGHEMSHAIQCHYFVVPPPVKISEVLSGYVEYQLRKR